MQWTLVQLLAFLASVSQISSYMEGRTTVTGKTGSSAVITCDFLRLSAYYLHWYQFLEGKAPRRLLYQYVLSNSKAKMDSGISQGKYYAYKTTGNSYKLELKNLEKSDSGRTISTDLSPKPTMFLPSVAETNLHDAGTCLCLLEKFFPDVIYVHWKEKNGHRILESQQGNTMKTNDTYMKLSWLTVSGNSLDKEHQCIVKHENNKGGVDQEILFPPIRKAMATIDCTEAYLKNENEQVLLRKRLFREALRLQLTSTSAYYTYLLLLLKSTVYSAVITVCLFRRAALCGTGNSVLQTEAQRGRLFTVPCS